MTLPDETYARLLAYAAGELAGADADEVEALLARSAEAREVVSEYRLVQRTFRDDDTVEPSPDAVARARALFRESRSAARRSWLEAVDRFVARLIFDSRLQPALGFRGGAGSVQLSFESERAEVDLELTKHEKGWRIVGQVSGAKGEVAETVGLARTGSPTLLMEAPCDEHGMFSLDAPPEPFDVHVRFPNAVVTLPEIEIGS